MSNKKNSKSKPRRAEVNRNEPAKLTMNANNKAAKWIVYSIILAILIGTGLSFLGAPVPLDQPVDPTQPTIIQE